MQNKPVRDMFADMVKTATTAPQIAALNELYELLLPNKRSDDAKWQVAVHQTEIDGKFWYPSGAFNHVSARFYGGSQLLECLEFADLTGNNKFKFDVPTLTVFSGQAPKVTYATLELTEAEMAKRIEDLKPHRAALIAEARRLHPAYARTSMERELQKLVGIRY